MASYESIRQRLIQYAGLAPDATPEDAVVGAHRALAQAPSAVLVANLNDALGVVDRPNMPGTRHEWPNWSLPLPVPLESIETAELPRRIAREMGR